MELGRWARRLLRSYRVDVDPRGCCAQRLGGDLTILDSHTRAREAGADSREL
jgi:hypothetical protein